MCLVFSELTVFAKNIDPESFNFLDFFVFYSQNSHLIFL